MPELIGFDHEELETFSAATGQPAGTQRAPRSESPASQPPPTQQPPPVPRPPHLQQQGRQESGSQAQQYLIPVQQPLLQASGSQSQQYPPPMGAETSRVPPPRSEMRSRPSQERSLQDRPSFNRPQQEHSFQARPSLDRLQQERPLRPTDSEERITQMPGSFPQSDFVRDIRPQNSQGQMRNKRSGDSITQNGSYPPQDPNLSRPSTDPYAGPPKGEPPYRVLHSARQIEERNRQNSNYGYGSGTPPRGAQGPTPFRPGPPSSQASQESLKEQSRPPTAESKPSPLVPRSLRTQSSNESSRPPTLDKQSREPSKERWQPLPDPSKDSLQPPRLQRAAPSEGSNYDDARPSTAVRATTPDVTPPSTTTENTEPDLHTAPPSQSTEPTPPETPTETHRPGLGPMIKANRSNKELATTFRKAATAYNAFKPRAGGAGDKLRDQPQSPTGEPNGITGVVPAPSLMKGASLGRSNDSRSQTPDLKSPDQLYQQGPVPTVTVDSPPQKPMSPLKSGPYVQGPPSPQETPAIQHAKTDQQANPAEDQRRNRKSDHSAKYAKALAVNPQILAGRTSDVETALNDFGWGEEPSNRCSYEELQANVQTELERAEAGGWVNAIEQTDDRIVALGGMMDRVIAECEELDGLLTLYGVELSVSPTFASDQDCIDHR